jgi:hypothetical protein
MSGFEVREKLSRAPDPALFGVLQTLAGALLGIGTGGDVEQALVGFGVLHDGRRPPPHSQHTTGRLVFLSCFMKSPDRRRNVVSDWMSFAISIMASPLFKHLFRCYQNSASG